MDLHRYIALSLTSGFLPYMVLNSSAANFSACHTNGGWRGQGGPGFS